MRKIIFVYGSIAGLIVVSGIILGLILSGNDTGSGAVVFGYFLMLLALTLIFAGIKKHRDRDLGGVIRFWPAFGLGLGISVVAAIAYIVGWEVYLSISDHAFINEYIQKEIETKTAAGLSGEDLQAFLQKMDKLKMQYGKMIFRIPMTFSEIFPVGVLVSLVSAALLRNPKVFAARK